MNKKQITSSQLLYSTEKIDLKKQIASTVIIKNLMRQEMKKNERIHASSDFERSNKSKNRVKIMSERLSTSENILKKYDN